MDVYGSESEKLVELTDIVVDSSVNVLKAYGFARFVKGATINLSKVAVDLVKETETEYNVRLTGNVNLATSGNKATASLFVRAADLVNTSLVGGRKAVKVIASQDVISEVEKLETYAILWGSYTVA